MTVVAEERPSIDRGLMRLASRLTGEVSCAVDAEAEAALGKEELRQWGGHAPLFAMHIHLPSFRHGIAIGFFRRSTPPGPSSCQYSGNVSKGLFSLNPIFHDAESVHLQ